MSQAVVTLAPPIDTATNRLSHRIHVEGTLNKRVEATLRQNKTNVRFEHLIAGLSGGVVSTLILHPLDLIKIR